MKKNDCLQTPEYVYTALGPFSLDPCAGRETNIGAQNFDGILHCGLREPWEGLVFVNPPFSQKEQWIEKCIEHNNGILLLPERGSAPWFGPLAEKCGCYFVMGKKINFIGGSSSNNVGSCLFPFGKLATMRVLESGLPGHFVTVHNFTPREAA